MKASRILTVLLSFCAISLSVTAQTKSDEVQTIVPGVSDITVSWDGKPTIVPIRANNNYTVTSNSDWLKSNIIENGKRIAIYGDTTVLNTPRSATLTILSADGSMVRTIQVQQEEEKSYETIIDKIISPTYAEASSNNGSNNVDKLFDGNLQSYWSTSYSNVSESNPAVLTINFKGTETIDYMVYTPRSGSNVGTWVDYTVKVIDHGKEIINSYSVIANSTPDTIRWEQGITPNQIIITITKGYSNYASGAELSFYEKSKHAEDLAIFGNKVYSKLREGVTQADIDALQNPFCKLLARGLYNGTYDTTYRYGSYPCRLHYNVLSDEWNAPGKSYSQIDNPTGINFRTGDKKAVFVSGIPSDLTAQMCITAWYVGKDGQSFDGGNPHQVYYTLHNGLNVIEYNYEWDGLA